MSPDTICVCLYPFTAVLSQYVTFSLPRIIYYLSSSLGLSNPFPLAAFSVFPSNLYCWLLMLRCETDLSLVRSAPYSRSLAPDSSHYVFIPFIMYSFHSVYIQPVVPLFVPPGDATLSAYP